MVPGPTRQRRTATIPSKSKIELGISLDERELGGQRRWWNVWIQSVSYDLESGSGDGLAPHPICSRGCIILGYGMSLPCIHLLLEPRPSQKYVKIDKEGSAMEQRGRLPASPLIMRCMENACSSCMGEPGKFLERDLAYKPIRGSTRTEDSCSMKEARVKM